MPGRWARLRLQAKRVFSQTSQSLRRLESEQFFFGSVRVPADYNWKSPDCADSPFSKGIQTSSILAGKPLPVLKPGTYWPCNLNLLGVYGSWWRLVFWLVAPAERARARRARGRLRDSTRSNRRQRPQPRQPIPRSRRRLHRAGRRRRRLATLRRVRHRAARVSPIPPRHPDRVPRRAIRRPPIPVRPGPPLPPQRRRAMAHRLAPRFQAAWDLDRRAITGQVPAQPSKAAMG